MADPFYEPLPGAGQKPWSLDGPIQELRQRVTDIDEFIEGPGIESAIATAAAALNPDALSDVFIADQVSNPTSDTNAAVVSLIGDETADILPTALSQAEAAITPDSLGLQKPVVHVILAMGQSNMEGHGLPTNSTTDPVRDNILQYGYNARVLAPASEPLDMVGSPTGVGPALLFARRYMNDVLKSSPRDIAVVVPAAKGSSPLIGTDTDSWQWGGAPGNLSARAVIQTQEAIAAAGVAYPEHEVKVAAILWHQGERDGFNNVSMSDYLTALTTLITNFRITFGDKIPFILGQIVPEAMGDGTRVAINEAHSRAAQTLPRVGFALGKRGMTNDNIHYNAQGQRHMAASMYAEYNRVVVGLSPDVPIQNGSVVEIDMGNLMTVRGKTTVTDASTTVTTITVPFPRKFGAPPVVTTQAHISATGRRVDAYGAGETVDGFSLRYVATNNLTADAIINWIAVGPKLEA